MSKQSKDQHSALGVKRTTSMSVLVAGTDASGKTTFLESIKDRVPDAFCIEPRSNPAIRRFKSDTLLELITADFITRREKVYMGLHDIITPQLISAQLKGNIVATSASPVITYTAHAAMSALINEPVLPISDIVDNWLEEAQFTPDKVVLLEAPMPVIERRIIERQQEGDSEEIIWGFNSLYYLGHYQRSLQEMACAFTEAGSDVYQFDTSHSRPEEIVNHVFEFTE
jgi:deoxyadenosine/deoxycytidine kinase